MQRSSAWVSEWPIKVQEYGFQTLSASLKEGGTRERYRSNNGELPLGSHMWGTNMPPTQLLYRVNIWDVGAPDGIRYISLKLKTVVSSADSLFALVA